MVAQRLQMQPRDQKVFGLNPQTGPGPYLGMA